MRQLQDTEVESPGAGTEPERDMPWWRRLLPAFQPHRELTRGPVLYPGERNVKVPIETVPGGGEDTFYPAALPRTMFNTRPSLTNVVTFHGLWDHWSDPLFRTISYANAPFVAMPSGRMEVDPIRKNISKPTPLPLGAYFDIGADTYQDEAF